MIKLKNDVLSFVFSGEYERVYDNRVLKRVDLPSGKLSSYYDTDVNDAAFTLGSSTNQFRFIVENDTGNVVMLSPLYLNDYRQLYIESVYQNSSLFKKQDTFLKKISYEISDNILNHMSTLEDEILKTINIDDYMEQAENEYKRKNTLQNPFIRNYHSINAYMIDAFLNDKALLRDISIKQIDSNDFEKYEQYIGLKYAIDKYEKALLTDPILSRKKAICDIINSDKYKTFTVKYKSLNGMILDEKVNKNKAANSNIKSTIMDKDNICSIPVSAVEQIVWSKQILFDTSKFPKLELTDEDIKFNFATTGSIEDLDKDDFKNKSLMKRIISKDYSLFNYVSKELASDMNFVKEVLDEVKEDNGKVRILLNSNFDKSFYINEDFVLYFLKSLSNETRNSGRYNYYFTNCINILANEAMNLNPYSLEIPLLILEKTNNISEALVKVMPSSIWDDERAVEILSKLDFDAYEPRTIAPQIHNTENIKKIFSPQEIINCLDIIDKSFLYERDYLIDLLNNTKGTRNIKYKSIVDIYANDDEVINAIIHNASANINITELSNLLNPVYDSKRAFELVSKNVMFFNALTRDDQKTFLSGEFGDKEYISVSIDEQFNSVIINAPNSRYELSQYGYIFISDHDGTNRVDIKRFSDVAEFFVDVLKEEYPNAPTKNGIVTMVCFILENAKNIAKDEPER